MAKFTTLCVKQGGKLVPADREGMNRYAAALGDGEECSLTFDTPEAAEEGRTRRQECGFHAMIAPWAKAEGHDIADLKRDLLEAIFGTREHVDAISGHVVLVLREPHTSKLSKKNYSELIERTLEIGARMGFPLKAPDEWRMEQEQVARLRASGERRSA